MKRILALGALLLFFAVNIQPVFGQSLGNAGTIEGTLLDPFLLFFFSKGLKNSLSLETVFHKRSQLSVKDT